MDRYAGVVLDFYDDKGSFLKSKFPTQESLPDLIKSASIQPEDKLPNEAFALVATDSGNILRKFACTDAGTTAMSVMYFLENKGKLPEDAVKAAAANLTLACLENDILPPEKLIKLADSEKLAARIDPAFIEEAAKQPGWLGRLVGEAAHPAVEEIQHGLQQNIGEAAEKLLPMVDRLQNGMEHGTQNIQRGLESLGESARIGAGDLKNSLRNLNFTAEAFPTKSREEAQKLIDSLLHRGSNALQNVAVGGALGGIAGGVGGGVSQDDPYGGIARGIGGGMVGGALGHSFGAGHVPAAIGGTIGGGAAGVAFGHKGKSKKASIIDITGKNAQVKLAAGPTKDEDYAVVLPDGSQHYPIDSWDRIKTAEAYYLDENKRMEPPIRRTFAVKLASKALDVGYPINDSILEAGSATYANPGMIQVSLEMRKLASPDKNSSVFLNELFEKRAQLDPGMFAECLYRFDCQTGIDKLWDREIPDPWQSTFGFAKTAADEIVYESGDVRLRESELLNLAFNRLDLVKKTFTNHIATGFVEDPIGIFNSMPLPQKHIMARMAADAAANGKSEFSVKTAQKLAQVEVNRKKLPFNLSSR